MPDLNHIHNITLHRTKTWGLNGLAGWSKSEWECESDN